VGRDNNVEFFLFAQPQNLTNTIQTNNSNSEFCILPTISKGAQEILDFSCNCGLIFE
jgi:hypothetical protein